jgi:large subunit ribosomal protein L32e
MRQFLRADTFRLSRLGKKRPKLLKWRRPRGKHNKLRLKRVGHPVQPEIGFRSSRKERYLVSGLRPILVRNLKDLASLKKDNSIILARVGAKKKLEIIKVAKEKGFKILNLGGQK